MTESNQPPSKRKRSLLWLWILLGVIAIVLLFAIISMVVVSLFSNSVQDMWDDAASELGNGVEASGEAFPMPSEVVLPPEIE